METIKKFSILIQTATVSKEGKGGKHMNYEIVELKEKQVEGIKVRTGHFDTELEAKIGGLWMEFFTKGIYGSIQNKINGKAIGLYTNYANNFSEYDCVVCSEVSSTDSSSSLTIPTGKYAKFIVKGHVKEACINFWMKLKDVDIDRKFQCDFEEYQNQDMENAEIHMYISIN